MKDEEYTKSAFELASKIEDKLEKDSLELIQRKKENLNLLWNRLGDIIVACPKCDTRQKVRTVKSTKCRRCNKTFTICPVGKKSNITYSPSRAILFKIQCLELGWIIGEV